VQKGARRREPETATIEALTHDGRGIAAIEGKKVFVPGALPGEQVRIARRKIRRGHDEADLVEILEPSTARVVPRCAAFGVCGGCALQHVDAADQRGIKQKSLKDSLERIGGVTPERWLEPIFDPAPDAEWEYRRRARLAVRDVAAKGRVLVGFRERRAALVTDMHRCEVLAPPLGRLIDPLSDLIGQLSIRARLPQVEFAAGDNAIELVFRVLDPPTAADRERLLRFGEQHGLRISLQPGGVDSVEPLSPEPREALYYELPEFGLRICFEPTDFVQVNGPVNRQMIAAAVDLLQLHEDDRVLDLFCGIGNFSLPLARRAACVLGIEGESAQVTRAARNAERNGIGNCEFRVSDLAAVQGKEQWLRRQAWDKVLLDPPRSGAEAVVRNLAKTGAARVVCVSCHPATLARDAGILTKTQGYRLEAAGIIDMFPHTAHVEAIALFSKHRRP
jgi:23S rRNA (uracil1939-C5)-methyltransferase